MCAVENLSVGGTFIRTSQPLPLGTEVSLILARPGMKRSLRLKGTVVSVIDAAGAAARRGAPGVGIRFEGLSAQDTERLVQLVGELEREGGVHSPEDPARPAPAEEPELPIIDVQELTVTAPPPPEAPPPEFVRRPPSTSLLLKVEGLLNEIDDLKERLKAKDAEIASLRRELLQARQQD